MIEIAGLNSVDLSLHVAKTLSAADFEGCDFVITMTKMQKRILKTNFEGYQDKIVTLNELAGFLEQDIDDPYGSTIEAYGLTFASIKKAVDAWIAQMKL